MSEPPKRGRVHDAEGAREAILNAAEEVFAQHGFDGARIDAIAKVAGYNKSLIFQYFDDKLGLYSAVVRRADKITSGLQAQLIPKLLHDEAAFTYEIIKRLLTQFLKSYFDVLVENPRFMRILLWEMAEGWQTMAKIMSQRDREEVSQFKLIIQKLQAARLLRPSFDQVAMLTLIEFLFPCYLSLVPLNQFLQPDVDVSSAAALERARQDIIDFALRGLLADPPGGNP
jgi:AcrR family transcriptional regulator